ncbi:prolyl 4-hydroxylase subunit alpha-1-like isoform X2 [Syngnathus acus]|uniref:prolyl 4-hydroxylase subunit alpha-1-like isoform X2 n=1 Tax=Syngnathus acus TaxID=161584 RepID=UPI001885CDE7|nr:prolyl 4-hydroxylase subunit alpha-1-like isoform X2 [Syngnathus acus]
MTSQEKACRHDVRSTGKDMALFCLLLVISFSSADEFFSSIGQMTELLHTEKDLLTSLEDYIRAEETKLETVKSWAQRLANLSALAIQDPEVFLGHPINAFQLLKRMNREWSNLESLVRSNVSDGFMSEMDAKRQYFPGEDDQTGVAEAFLRLQDTYQLDTDTLAKGQLPGQERHRASAFAMESASKRPSPLLSSGTSVLPSVLTVDDCYDLAMAAYKDSDFYHTVLWLSQALKQMEEGEMAANVKVVTLLDYQSFAFLKQGDLERGLESTKKLLELDPENLRANQNLRYFEHHLEKQKTGEETAEVPKGRGAHNAKYERLCRGDSIEMTPRRQSRLFCRYYDNQRHPNLVIAPVKEEDLWDKPRIIRYYDIITDEDMAVYKKLARPKLIRSRISDYESNRSYAVPTRISQNAWLEDIEHESVAKMVKKMSDITGLDSTTAEAMQVANYGVGGQYEPHHDFQGDEVEEPYRNLGTGNRIATWLVYISEVPAGGATVFPQLGAVAWPIKGSAVFWYNLLLNGKGNYQTHHAACPVLVGSKWVANKWLHERGQEFRRRCGLQNS